MPTALIRKLFEGRMKPALLVAFFLVLLMSGASTRADELDNRAAMWRTNAPLCAGGATWHAFPTKQFAPPSAQPCNDGDMTLFLGLLCAVGEAQGCTGVQEAFEATTGRWARSPRIRALGYNPEGDAFFSPDMALGVELYLVTTKDTDRASKWLQWLNDNVDCPARPFGLCPDFLKVPRVCTEVIGCYMSHGAMSILAQTVNWLQHNAGLADLPNGPLRGRLGTFSGYVREILDIDSAANKEGFSEHLVGVGIMLLRKQGIDDTNIALAARILATRNPKNAFFAYLDEGPTQRVLDLTLERCPKSPWDGKRAMDEWQWERGDNTPAAQQSCYWDCVFMHRLLRG